MAELATFRAHSASWADAYTPPPELHRPGLGRFPLLGEGFELTERNPGACRDVARVHLFNHAAIASMGATASDIPGVSTGAERLASRVAQHFFHKDFDSICTDLEAFAERELEPTPFFVKEVFEKAGKKELG
jgi:hypothetical protein